MTKSYCFFSAHYLPNLGGVEQYTHFLAKELLRAGNRVTIVTSNVFGLSEYEIDRENIEIYRLPCFNLANARCPITKYNSGTREIWKKISKMPLDFVIVNTRFYVHSVLGLRLAKKKKIPAIVIDHGSDHIAFGNSFSNTIVAGYEHVMTMITKRYNRDFYGVSQASCQWLSHFGIEAKGVISNSIDADNFRLLASNRDYRKEFSLKDTTMIVSFAGRMIPEKGVKELIDAARLLYKKNIVFLLAGEGALLDSLSAESPSNVIFLRRISREDMSALLTQSDIFCLPTRSEGFSTSLLEASACQTATIITRTGGVDELIPSEEYGIVISDTQPQTIAKALTFAHDNPVYCKNAGKKINERVKSCFSWKKTANILTAVMESYETK